MKLSNKYISSSNLRVTKQYYQRYLQQQQQKQQNYFQPFYQSSPSKNQYAFKNVKLFHPNLNNSNKIHLKSIPKFTFNDKNQYIIIIDHHQTKNNTKNNNHKPQQLKVNTIGTYSQGCSQQKYESPKRKLHSRQNLSQVNNKLKKIRKSTYTTIKTLKNQQQQINIVQKIQSNISCIKLKKLPTHKHTSQTNLKQPTIFQQSKPTNNHFLSNTFQTKIKTKSIEDNAYVLANIIKRKKTELTKQQLFNFLEKFVIKTRKESKS